MNKTYENIKPLKKRDKWHKGVVSPQIFYPPLLQIDNFNVLFGFGRPIDRVRLLRVVNNSVVVNIATGLLVPDCKLIWSFNTTDKSDTYNPIGDLRVLNAGISGKNDVRINLGDQATDINIEMDVYQDSSNNWFYLNCIAYLPIAFAGLRIDGFFTLFFEYQ